MAEPVTPLEIKLQVPTTEEHVLKLVQLRALPRELLLQQTLQQTNESIECFFCSGKGSTGDVERDTEADTVKKAFHTIDKDGNGTISHDELKDALAIMNASAPTGKLAAGEIDHLVKCFDRDGDGQIDFEEFVSWLFMPGDAIAKFRNDLGKYMLPKVVWLYREGRGSLAVFDRQMAATLNAAFAEGVGAAVRVRSPAYEYIVDLDTMTQTNQKSGKEREIMRISDGKADAMVDWLSPQSVWSVILGGKPRPFDAEVTSVLEAAWHAHQVGALENPVLPLNVDGHIYELDVAKMTQTNPKSRKARKIIRSGGEGRRGHGEDKPILIRMPTGVPLEEGICWVCRGSGTTSKFLEPFDEKDADLPDCLICYCDVATYGVSTSCDHAFCDDCIRGSLEAMMESGQFPALCPLCRAETGGADLETGRIDDSALTFLQQRGVITKPFQFRFQKQQCKALELEEPEIFECPGKCGEFLIGSGPYIDEHHIGEHFDDPGTGRVGVRLGQCPSCNSFVCIKCQIRLPKAEDGGPPLHRCEGDEPVAAEPDEATLEVMAAIGKKCPKCGNFIEKNEGCHIMMCGDAAHGKLKNCITTGGCCASFDWNTMNIMPDSFEDLDGARKGGPCVTARQFKGHPKCARPECNYFKSADEHGGTQGKNNGGDYCCDKCREDGTHQVFCHQMAYVKPR